MKIYLAIAFLGCWSATLKGGALEDYVSNPDNAFAWKVRETTRADGFISAHLEVTSQKWRDYQWTHHVRVVRPEKVRNPDIAFLFITGSGEGKSSLKMLRTLAEQAGAVAAVVTQVPNQPLYEGRSEDALIAYTFDQYLRTRDTSWPLLFPMVKSAIKAMDAVEVFLSREHEQTVQRWVVAGASKRGWTTWLTAAVDSRVKAIAPMVIDMLNMSAQVKWAEKAYGRQSEKIRDYTDLDLVARMDHPDMKQLREWVDPYNYRNRYTMPKLILLGTNDPYWTVDSLRHYWHDLPGPKLVFQTPNAGHDLAGGREAIPTLAAFYEIIAHRHALPVVKWEISYNRQAELQLHVDQNASAICLWTADSPDRDFRNDQWTSRELEVSTGSSQVTARVEAPATGYRAFLGEVKLTTPSGHSYKVSTEARVVPDMK